MSGRVLVAGATGLLGREIVRNLNTRGVFARAMGRDPLKLRVLCPSANQHCAADALTAPLAEACAGMDMVISCLGASVIPKLGDGRKGFSDVDTLANRRLIQAAEHMGIRRFAYVSVFAGNAVAGNGFVTAHEDVVETLRLSSLDCTVIRPTGFFGSLVRIMRESSFGLLPEWRGGSAMTNPIHEMDLASFCVDTVCERRTGEFAVGGPEVLTRREIASLICRGFPARKTNVGALRVGAAILRPANRRVSELMRFIADILSTDSVAPCFGSRTLSEYVAG